MNENKLPIPKNRLLSILCFNLGILMYAAIAKTYNLEFSNFIYGASISAFFITWFIVVIDMKRNEIFNKVFWLLSMFIIPHISSILYVIQREKIIRLYQKT
jgi:hypothetical protein